MNSRQRRKLLTRLMDVRTGRYSDGTITGWEHATAACGDAMRLDVLISRNGREVCEDHTGRGVLSRFRYSKDLRKRWYVGRG